MKIGIIGAGFTGLATSYYLSQKGHEIFVFEKGARPGGLAIGYWEKGWRWSLEEHYHHWFTNDARILALAQEIGHTVLTKRGKTSSFVENELFQLDSPVSLLQFSKLSLFDRIRMGASLALLRYNPFWKALEHVTAESYLKTTMGGKTYKKIWQPLMTNKLGKYARRVSLAWFWARVYKRTPSLSYPEGGFLRFGQHLQKEIEEHGGTFYYNTTVSKIKSQKSKVKIITANAGFRYGGTTQNSKVENFEFDSVIVTLPSFLFTKIAEGLPASYVTRLHRLKGIGAVNMVLRLKEQFMRDGTYWLNMCDSRSPILAVVEHTNFMDKKHYNNEHIVYVGNYMSMNDKRFRMSAEELLKLYNPWLKKISPRYKSTVISYKLFRAPFAQPIIPRNYSKLIPPFETPLKNVYLANIEQVYPWDRGTNYAVALGKKVAELIMTNF